MSSGCKFYLFKFDYDVLTNAMTPSLTRSPTDCYSGPLSDGTGLFSVAGGITAYSIKVQSTMYTGGGNYEITGGSSNLGLGECYMTNLSNAFGSDIDILVKDENEILPSATQIEIVLLKCGTQPLFEQNGLLSLPIYTSNTCKYYTFKYDVTSLIHPHIPSVTTINDLNDCFDSILSDGSTLFDIINTLANSSIFEVQLFPIYNNSNYAIMNIRSNNGTCYNGIRTNDYYGNINISAIPSQIEIVLRICGTQPSFSANGTFTYPEALIATTTVAPTTTIATTTETPTTTIATTLNCNYYKFILDPLIGWVTTTSANDYYIGPITNQTELPSLSYSIGLNDITFSLPNGGDAVFINSISYNGSHIVSTISFPSYGALNYYIDINNVLPNASRIEVIVRLCGYQSPSLQATAISSLVENTPTTTIATTIATTSNCNYYRFVYDPILGWVTSSSPYDYYLGPITDQSLLSSLTYFVDNYNVIFTLPNAGDPIFTNGVSYNGVSYQLSLSTLPEYTMELYNIDADELMPDASRMEIIVRMCGYQSPALMSTAMSSLEENTSTTEATTTVVPTTTEATTTVCFDEDSMIIVNGKYINISYVKVGDELDTLNGKVKVKNIYKFNVDDDIELVHVNEYLKITKGHRLYINENETICENVIGIDNITKINKHTKYLYHIQVDCPCIRTYTKIGDHYCAVWGLYEEHADKCEKYIIDNY